jgi:hypothetical protein
MSRQRKRGRKPFASACGAVLRLFFSQRRGGRKGRKGKRGITKEEVKGKREKSKNEEVRLS